ncbi:Rz1-like lysis system protein LysC [Burkholderia sp. FERM BP-3421]|uniref:Rz1-like lysis system protein LysC n=1 Tax=Burkholderia sp. FERM BP-3421 TaxID=1494466 RepID=UPI00235E46C3|nr:Rz1-like lysis system protein LysC [Burkholderia sp. FERM BP-3421]WDD95936.1 Rz1-like lysis system protein LysC [Burkholderia sp. FERM BP-3421]
MTMRSCASGRLLPCLMMLCACTSTPPSPAPAPILNSCAPASRCTLPATSLRDNGDLRAALARAESAWAECAAVVDTIVVCQSDQESVHD